MMTPNNNPLASIDEWDDELLKRYPAAENTSETRPLKSKDAFRDYEAQARPSVREFYRLNHRYQTVDFVQSKRDQYLSLNKAQMGIWEAMEYLNQLVDDSDPDIDLPQIEHLLQTAEAIRADGRPRWFILAGLVHDLGKILCLWDEPQWAVVGDTFPVGCRFAEEIVFHEFLADNPDSSNARYTSELGIYTQGCGLDNVMLSWGHDEYLYHVVKPYLPPPALAMIRYHSCYPIHHEGAYGHLLCEEDVKAMKWVKEFNQYDLYTKRDQRMCVAELQPYYEELIAEYFPTTIKW